MSALQDFVHVYGSVAKLARASSVRTTAAHRLRHFRVARRSKVERARCARSAKREPFPMNIGSARRMTPFALARTILVKAGSNSSAFVASTSSMPIPKLRAATSTSRNCNPEAGFFGLRSTKTGLIAGAISSNISNSLPPKSRDRFVVPVILPPGRERLATRPAPIGSATPTMTIGIFCVAERAATVAGVPHVTIMLTSQSAGEVIVIPVGAPHAIIARTENWSVVIRSREMETAWRNWYDAEAGTVERKVFGYG